MLASIFLSFLFLFQLPGGDRQQQRTQQPDQQTPTTQQQTRPAPEEPVVITKHSMQLGGKTINYTATTGYMPIKNAQSGETEAKLFYVAYTMDNPPAKRPLMIAFNGGPGSATIWLHMGAIGPKRTKMMDNGFLPPPPYDLVDNDQTWFDQTDLVFVDPVGTGFSRAANQTIASKFFSLNGDIDSVAEFIRMYLVRNERWSSPLFLVGESYGTTRASGLSNALFEKGIALNGILLISTVMNFQTIRFSDNNDLPLVLIIPSYATTAWYHKKLSPQMQKKSVSQVAQEAEEFAANEYMPAMLKIDRLTAQEKAGLLDKLSNFTGLSKAYIEQNNFRIELDKFNKELLRDQRRTTGRLDSRFTGIDRDASGDSTDSDPSMNAIRPPYTATFNDYVHRELGFKTDLEYYALGGGIGRWDYNTQTGYADTSLRMKDAMAKNPYMKIFIGQGYYDMATPFFAAEYTVSAMNLDPGLRKNIEFNYYESGHMMYIEKVSLKKLKDDAAAFIQKSIPK